MSYLGGLAGQAGRNVVLEPWRANTRSADRATRAGELTTDGAFIVGGGGAAVLGIRSALRAGGPLATAGWATLAGVGVLAAATGVKNLFAKLPATPGPDPTKPDPSKPDPTKPDPSKPDPTKPDPTKPDPTMPDPTTPGPTDPEPTEPDPVDPTDPVDPDPQPAPTSHTVRPGETLAFIADCYLTDWRELYTYNRAAIGPNPDVIDVGTRLRIPPKDYTGPSFQYAPSTRGGILPAGLACLPESLKAQLEKCD